jgi:hypothetical protein
MNTEIEDDFAADKAASKAAKESKSAASRIAKARRVGEAVYRLATTARPAGDGTWTLDVHTLLGDLLASAEGVRYVRFAMGEHEVTIERARLAKMAQVLRDKAEVARVDRRGLTVAWRGGRSWLTYYGQPTSPVQEPLVLPIVIR